MWKITNKSDNEAEVLLYDDISNFDSEQWGYMSAKGLINKIKALGKIDNITLRINSYGGDVFQAQAMYNYLKSHPANVTVRVDGLAASAASMVAMAGDKIIMPENSLMMIHNLAWMGVTGEADDLRETADILDKIRDLMIGAYSAKTGLESDKLISMMNDETWLTANEAHGLGFCDEVIPAVEIAATALNGGIIFRNGFGFSRVDGIVNEKISQALKNIQLKRKSKEENSEMEIKNVQELESAFPDFVKQIRDSAVNAERERLKALDNMNAPGREGIIAKAKYEDPKDVRDIALELLSADNVTAGIKALHQDARVIDGALMPERNPNAQEEKEFAMNAVVAEIKRMRGY